MLAQTYPGTYRDKGGVEPIALHNDGQTLRVTIRQVAFEGTDFDGLEAVDGPEVAEAAGFVLCSGSICSCTITCTMPLPVVTPEGVVQCELLVELVLGDPKPLPRGGIDREDLRLRLRMPGREIASSGRSGWFEDELLDIQRQLTAGHLHACIACAFSDYSPYGHGLFGGLACFRDNKRRYLAVENKQDLFAIWNTLTEFVQETYLCSEFQRREPGTGYRG